MGAVVVCAGVLVIRNAAVVVIVDDVVAVAIAVSGAIVAKVDVVTR